MFSKILIVEDLDSIALGLTTALKDISNATLVTAKNGTEALLKFKRAHNDSDPFDLLITDLSFIQYEEKELSTGEQLIDLIRDIEPTLKIIVYSVEDRPYRIYALFHHQNINGFIAKGRESLSSFSSVLKMLESSEAIYISPQFLPFIENKVNNEIEDYDVQLLKLLAKGFLQAEISEEFKKQQFATTSTSSIEKRINKLKIILKAQNTIHLVAIAKDLGII